MDRHWISRENITPTKRIVDITQLILIEWNEKCKNNGTEKCKNNKTTDNVQHFTLLKIMEKYMKRKAKKKKKKKKRKRTAQEKQKRKNNTRFFYNLFAMCKR